MWSFFYTFLLFAIVSGPLVAAPITVGEALSIALENNPETRQAWWAAKRAAASVKVAQSAYYPTIDFAGSVTNGREFQFIEGPEVSYTTIRADLVLGMMLCDFGRTQADVQAAKMALLAAQWQTDWALQRVMIRVMEGAYATMYAQATLQAALTSLEDAQKMLHAAQELNRAGLRPVTDVYTSQATASQMEMDVAQQRALYDIQRGKLATAMGLSADADLELIDIDDLPPPPEQTITTLIAYAQAQRSDLQVKQARIAEALARQKRARVDCRPRLSLSGTGGAQHTLHDHTDAGHYDICLNLEVPIFNGFLNVFQNRQAVADVQITLQEQAQLELDISLEVLTHSRSLEASQQMLGHAKAGLLSTENAYQGVMEKYRAGKEGIAEVSNALRQLAAARARFSEVYTRYLTSLANLAYATGTLSPYMESPCE